MAISRFRLFFEKFEGRNRRVLGAPVGGFFEDRAHQCGDHEEGTYEVSIISKDEVDRVNILGVMTK